MSVVLVRNSQLSSPGANPKVCSADLSVLKLTFPTKIGWLSAVALWNNTQGRPATVVRTFGFSFCASVRMPISLSIQSAMLATPVLYVPEDSAKSVFIQKADAGNTSSVT